jgi:flagellar hook-basal body complex protein FliE
MTVEKLYGSIPRARLLEQIESASLQSEAKPQAGKGFGEMLTDALGQVAKLQTQAEQKIGQSMTGSSDVAPHDLMITLEKADVAFQLMNKVRTNLIRAYEEVMRTQV